MPEIVCGVPDTIEVLVDPPKDTQYIQFGLNSRSNLLYVDVRTEDGHLDLEFRRVFEDDERQEAIQAGVELAEQLDAPIVLTVQDR